MSEKFILDATAGFRMMWFNKQHPNTIFVDQREEVKPDIIADFRNLKNFPDGTFKLIVFDPPHKVYSDKWVLNWEKNFGCLRPETWHIVIRDGFKELWRLLKLDGILLFKWSDTDIKVENVLKLIDVQPLFGQVTTGQSGHRKRAKTYWFCFMKIPENTVTAKSNAP